MNIHYTPDTNGTSVLKGFYIKTQNLSYLKSPVLVSPTYYILSVLYGSSTCKAKSTVTRKLQAFAGKCLGHVIGVVLGYTISNEELSGCKAQIPIEIFIINNH